MTKTNTAKFMPHNSVVPILLESEDCPECPFFSGTGFFVRFPPFSDVFLVTAKHCVIDNNDKLQGSLEIPLLNDSICKQKAIFTHALTGKACADSIYEDDVIIYIADNINEQIKTLTPRCLSLPHQEDVELYLNSATRKQENLRTIGFPATGEKQIDYDNKKAIAQARGFYGKLTTSKADEYIIEDINWQDNNGRLNGFSGAPIIFLQDTGLIVTPIPVGILTTGSAGIVRFLSINVITNIIASYLNDHKGHP